MEDRLKNDREWISPLKDRSAFALPRREVLLAADRHGCAIISAPRIARLAGVSPRTAWGWLRGQRISSASDRAIRAALNLPLRAA